MYDFIGITEREGCSIFIGITARRRSTSEDSTEKTGSPVNFRISEKRKGHCYSVEDPAEAERSYINFH